MRQSWDTIRAKASAFSKEWTSETYERGEAQSFYNDLFDIFGQRRRGRASFEERVTLANARNGRIDLFWKGVFLAEHKSAGADMIRARAQAINYLGGISNQELPRYVLVCDFQTFDLTDLETGDQVFFPLRDLHKHVERFGFMVGAEKRVFRDQDSVNILAAELMGKLHDSLKESGYDGAPLERLLVRLLFCLFADDTGIFERDDFENYIKDRTSEDGADLGPKLNLIFQVLNTPEDIHWRRGLEEELRRLPYVNGDLFAETLPIANFTKKTRESLLEACGFFWERISPAIFGSLFQSVMDRKERRRQGAHYTTEKNILKVIEPLFLDDLRAEFAHALTLKRDKRQRLEALHDKIARLKFLDPACGCGNFLVIAYRELRELELQILHALFDRPGENERLIAFDPVANARVNVDQFAGIELGEFPVRIAETAMWMMDHIMNTKLSLEFHKPYVRIPLRKTAHIVHGDALELDWAEVLAPAQCSYVFGNPPFVGAKMQTLAQRAQVLRIADIGGGTLDYVAAWFVKAGRYVNTGGGATDRLRCNQFDHARRTSRPALAGSV